MPDFPQSDTFKGFDPGPNPTKEYSEQWLKRALETDPELRRLKKWKERRISKMQEVEDSRRKEFLPLVDQVRDLKKHLSEYTDTVLREEHRESREMAETILIQCKKEEEEIRSVLAWCDRMLASLEVSSGPHPIACVTLDEKILRRRAAIKQKHQWVLKVAKRGLRNAEMARRDSERRMKKALLAASKVIQERQTEGG